MDPVTLRELLVKHGVEPDRLLDMEVVAAKRQHVGEHATAVASGSISVGEVLTLTLEVTTWQS